jgi:isoleucyl-tRNA synthetase
MKEKRRGSVVDYKKTLNLPVTEFPMRASLPAREPGRVEWWEQNRIYQKMTGDDDRTERFLLHDGPPYANGHIHSGTVLNKVLKDFVVKFQNMSGRRCEYRPGWDCHGLPIENNVEREEGKGKDQFTVSEFRRKCRDFAMRYLDIQRREFKRLGVLGDFDNPYTTLLRTYEATIAREFGKVVGKGALYKRKKPVLWCAHHVTALAEAEVEYEELSSPSIWVKFAMGQEARSRFPGLPAECPGYFVIWTTTPWTLPSNLAITLHPELEYCCLVVGQEAYVVAAEMKERFLRDCGLGEAREAGCVLGQELERTVARHPFLDRDSLIILGDFVTTETGTGCVHTAPGHGTEDYEAGLRYGLDIYAPVDDLGRFTSEVPLYQGQFVFATDASIVAKLKSDGSLLKVESYRHSYPVCQRCKNPVIFRATSQWFIDVDGSGLRSRALEIIPTVNWIPARGQQRISSMVETRPDWCLSRQRLWGLPIVVFYCNHCGKELVHQDIVNHVADIFQQEGADAWYDRSASELLPAGTSCAQCGHSEFTKETDIVDVWFESGVSYAAVMEDMYGPDTICDLYLEGSDQHRGWFQSTLLESVLTRDRAPFKTVLTHGFVVDGEGKKISKTLGNYIPPEKIINEFGAEIYRLWVMAENYQEDVRISDEVLKTFREAYMKIRNTFRYLLGTLDGFDPDKDRLPPARLLPLDRFMVHRTGEFIRRLNSAYEGYRFHDLYQGVMQFFSVDLSALYMDVVKDRLYVHPNHHIQRQSARAAMYEILNALVRALAPVLSFTCEEVWEHMPRARGDSESVLCTRLVLDLDVRYADPVLKQQFEQLLAVREKVNKLLEDIRASKEIGHSLEARVSLRVGRQNESSEAIHAHRDALRELFIVSELDIVSQEGDELAIEVARTSGVKCDRCWHRSDSTGSDAEHPQLCARCAGIIRELGV